jgi:hypothetical protein
MGGGEGDNDGDAQREDGGKGAQDEALYIPVMESWQRGQQAACCG